VRQSSFDLDYRDGSEGDAMFDPATFPVIADTSESNAADSTPGATPEKNGKNSYYA